MSLVSRLYGREDVGCVIECSACNRCAILSREEDEAGRPIRCVWRCPSCGAEGKVCEGDGNAICSLLAGHHCPHMGFYAFTWLEDRPRKQPAEGETIKGYQGGGAIDE